MKYAYPLLACTLVLLQTSLFADEAGAKPQKGPRKAPSAEQREAFQLKMFDKNGDGKLDEQELAASKAGREEMMKKFDTNGDGKLDEAERAAMKAKREEMKKKFDTNADGKLDEAERAAMMAACKAETGATADCAKPEQAAKKERIRAKGEGEGKGKPEVKREGKGKGEGEGQHKRKGEGKGKKAGGEKKAD